jgi:predicted metal-binding protein
LAQSMGIGRRLRQVLVATLAVFLLPAAHAVAATATGSRGPLGARHPLALSAPMMDFNGDGFADLAVGSYSERVDGVNRAGSVNVIYGSATGLQATGVGGPDDQFWTQNSTDLSGVGAQAAALFGHTMAGADYNGDGYTDLAVGAYFEDVGTAVDAGSVNVIYGSATGLQANGVGGPDDQYWTQDSAGMNADGAEAGDEFSHYVVGADFNGDGFADLAIGASGEDVGTITNAGAVDVLYGSSTGLQADGTGGPDDQFFTQDSAGVQDQAEKNDAFGESVGAGDFNGDGFDDLVVSVFLESLPGAYQAGAANVIYGSSCGLQPDPTCGNPDDQFLRQGSDGVQDTAEENDWFSRSPAAGDFNGDGYQDLALGAEKEDVGTVADAGSVNVIYGSSCGLQADPACGNPDDQFFTQGSGGVQDQAETKDYLGRSTRTGDFNGDGYADLAVSAFQESIGAVTEAGAVDVIYGSSCGLQPDPTCGNPDDQFWNQDSPGVQDVAEQGDELGKNMAPSGDYNGDGLADLAIGVHQEDVGAIPNAGMVNVLYGKATSGLQAFAPDDQKFVQGKNGLSDKAEAWDRFGWFG